MEDGGLVMERLGGLSAKERENLFTATAENGLRAKVGNTPLLEIAKILLSACRQELKRRGFGEEALLAPAEQTLDDGKNPAERLLEAWRGPLNRQIPELVQYAASP